ncbi:MAG TPA: hypothetical protein VH601_02465 [Bryobacteraceae bacterium]
MKLLDLYYFVKPAIPHNIRLRLRAYIAARRRRRYADVWPINDSTACQPEWWPGWPEGKRFAFVLTHDVEGRKGMERCRALAELEMTQGFRSSFNFVPEGQYDTPSSLRRFLADHGFEVGVHDLHHDGSLYRSKAEFSAAAARINRYLECWQAVGFRSAFMFHNLEWLKELNVLYDASTFDTDPFEPQPDSANTIFPFWVERSNGSGYVELPYTLPQDSTVFLILGERTNDIWKKKLDWVARHGGLALVNVHPDYLAFGERNGRTEFPVVLYEEFLAHVSAQFGKDAWCALPREIAHFVKNSVCSASPSQGMAVNALAKVL